MDHFELSGKYSFQYVENMVIKNSYLDTKDAFWHSKNVTVYDSVLKGEYLAWYSENLKLVRCKIIGTQPLCYAKGLILEDCEMIDTDLSFEKSDVQATIKGNIVSVKNPESGYICADSIDQIVLDAPTKCQIRCCNVPLFISVYPGKNLALFFSGSLAKSSSVSCPDSFFALYWTNVSSSIFLKTSNHKLLVKYSFLLNLVIGLYAKLIEILLSAFISKNSLGTGIL